MALSNHPYRVLTIFLGRKLVVIGAVFLLIFFIAGIFSSWLAPHDPYARDLKNVLAAPSAEHWLGTDTLGRDILSRIIYGAQTSLIIGFSSVSIATVLGVTLGLIAAYFGGITFIIIMRFIDALMSMPMLMVALTIATLLGGGYANVIIALGIGLMSSYARLMSAQVLTVKENEYILAARSMGAGSLRIMLKHIVPNCIPTLIVVMTMQLGAAILIEASLSFLSIGIKPPIAAWGSMVSDGYQHLITSPMLSFAPGIALMIVVFSFNMVGDGLRDILDPRLRGVL